MSKKLKPSKRKKKKVVFQPSPADKLFDLVETQIFHQDFAAAIANCERLLKMLSPLAPLRADVLSQMGVAHSMLQNYPQAYEAFTAALALNPESVEDWYNRCMACRFTGRLGRSLLDIQRAAELNSNPALEEKIHEILKDSRMLAEESIKLRGPNFTLDQLVQQEDFYQQGLQLMERGHWNEAEQAFQASIEMGDCLPQPWGNLGICFMMQERYDQAEATLKRALEVDPSYAIARNNLAQLDETRRSGPPAMIAVSDPFRNSGVKQSITFV